MGTENNTNFIRYITIRCFHRKTSIYIYLLISVSGALAEEQVICLRILPPFFVRQISTSRCLQMGSQKKVGI